MARNITNEVLTEEDLDRRSKINNHNRQEKINDVINNIMYYGLPTLSAVALLLVLVLLAHYIITGDWGMIETILKYTGIYLGGYVTNILKNYGLKNTK